MEETRLDKFIGKVFNRVENATEFLCDETKKRKVFSRLMILQILTGLVFIFGTGFAVNLAGICIRY